MGWPRLGQVEVDAVGQLGDGPISADLPDQMGFDCMNVAETRDDAPVRLVLLDGSGANPAAGALLRRLGFAAISATLRM